MSRDGFPPQSGNDSSSKTDIYGAKRGSVGYCSSYSKRKQAMLSIQYDNFKDLKSFTKDVYNGMKTDTEGKWVN